MDGYCSGLIWEDFLKELDLFGLKQCVHTASTLVLLHLGYFQDRTVSCWSLECFPSHQWDSYRLNLFPMFSTKLSCSAEQGLSKSSNEQFDPTSATLSQYSGFTKTPNTLPGSFAFHFSTAVRFQQN